MRFICTVIWNMVPRRVTLRVNKGRKGKLLLFVLVIYLVSKNDMVQAFTGMLKVHVFTHIGPLCVKIGFVSSISIVYRPDWSYLPVKEKKNIV